MDWHHMYSRYGFTIRRMNYLYLHKNLANLLLKTFQIFPQKAFLEYIETNNMMKDAGFSTMIQHETL